MQRLDAGAMSCARSSTALYVALMEELTPTHVSCRLRIYVMAHEFVRHTMGHADELREAVFYGKGWNSKQCSCPCPPFSTYSTYFTLSCIDLYALFLQGNYNKILVTRTNLFFSNLFWTLNSFHLSTFKRMRYLTRHSYNIYKCITPFSCLGLDFDLDHLTLTFLSFLNNQTFNSVRHTRPCSASVTISCVYHNTSKEEPLILYHGFFVWSKSSLIWLHYSDSYKRIWPSTYFSQSQHPFSRIRTSYPLRSTKRTKKWYNTLQW